MENCWIKTGGAERISSKGPPFTDAVRSLEGGARTGLAAFQRRVLVDNPHGLYGFTG
jgi:hypothetical protein